MSTVSGIAAPPIRGVSVLATGLSLRTADSTVGCFEQVRSFCWWQVQDSNLRSRKPTDLDHNLSSMRFHEIDLSKRKWSGAC